MIGRSKWTLMLSFFQTDSDLKCKIHVPTTIYTSIIAIRDYMVRSKLFPMAAWTFFKQVWMIA